MLQTLWAHRICDHPQIQWYLDLRTVTDATSHNLAFGPASPSHLGFAPPSPSYPGSPKGLNHPWRAPAPTIHTVLLAWSHPSTSQRFGGQPPSLAFWSGSCIHAGTERCTQRDPAPVHAARSRSHMAREHPACGCGVSSMAGAVLVLLRHVGPARRGLTVDYSLCLCISVHNAPHICILQCALN